MRQICAINLIMIYAFILFINNNSVIGHSLEDVRRTLSLFKQLGNLRKGILPGTLWCGFGNITMNNAELGTYKELDTCCKMHDYCDVSIQSKGRKYGLHNRNVCTSSSCECDLEFYTCLMQVDRFYASIVGKLYFRICNRCLRAYYDPQECKQERLEIKQENDNKGRPVFCAKFEKNVQWQITSRGKNLPASPDFSAWDDDGVEELTSYLNAVRNGEYSNEDNSIYDDYE